MRFAWHLLGSCLFFLYCFSRYRLRRRAQKRMAHHAFSGMSCRVGAQGPGPARGIFLNIFQDLRVFLRDLITNCPLGTSNSQDLRLRGRSEGTYELNKPGSHVRL
jgi:hypothetical protein